MCAVGTLDNSKSSSCLIAIDQLTKANSLKPTSSATYHAGNRTPLEALHPLSGVVIVYAWTNKELSLRAS